MDQTPLPFDFLAGKTYSTGGAKTVWVKGTGAFYYHTKYNSRPVPAFSPEIRSNFYEWIRHPDHTNRARMSIEKQQILQRFLRTPGLKPVSKLEKDLRSQVQGYRIDPDPTNNTLRRLRDSGHPKDCTSSP